MFEPINRQVKQLTGIPGPTRHSIGGASTLFLVYGKIIIDNIRLLDGTLVHGIIGGGGPQGAFGARLWNESVGLLSRSGEDIEEGPVQSLLDLDIDLSGWQKYPSLRTLRGAMVYDEKQQIIHNELYKDDPVARAENWSRLLSQPLPLSASFQQPRVIHLITEYYDEPMVRTALELRSRGALFSLEPLIDFREWKNRDTILSLMPKVDIVSPDWPSASGIAQSDDPRRVLEYWSKLGPAMVTVRNGHLGSYAWDRETNRYWHIPIVPVPVVDPTGAGNSYGGGATVGWLETHDALRAGCYGAVSASYLVRRYGLPKMTPELMAEARRLLDETVKQVTPL
jgi:sugar/nucleoside kinase (ribokinase family)